MFSAATKGASSGSGDYIAFTYSTSPYINAYSWSDGSGFGPKLANPVTALPGACRCVAFSPNNKFILITSATTPFLVVYNWAGGFGAKVSDPTTLPPGAGNSAAFAPDGNSIAMTHNGGVFVSGYPWSSSGFGTKYANPSSSPGGIGSTGLGFSPTSDAVAICVAGSPYLATYTWTSASGFGTKYTSFSLSNDSRNAAFSPNGSYVVIANDGGTYTRNWTFAGGYGTAITTPSITANDVLFSKTGGAVFGLGSAAASAVAWRFSGGAYGTQYTAPATTPTGSSGSNKRIAMNSKGTAVAFCVAATPYVYAYPWTDAGGFGTKYTDPTSLPASSSGGGVCFTN